MRWALGFSRVGSDRGLIPEGDGLVASLNYKRDLE